MEEEEGHAVRVCDLPLDVDESRLSDKLQIHFLRRRNGGGDISSISISKTTPRSAIITFQDSEVAQRVVAHGVHTLQVGEKQYAVTASLHKKEITADELLVESSVVVDYRKLPGGKAAMSDMCRSFPDVQVTFPPHRHVCVLEGGYSRVCALTEALLGSLDPRLDPHLDPHRPPDSQAFGTPASQAFGTVTSQAFGTLAPQAFGTPAPQAFGTPASQAFGTPASQAFGTPASKLFGTAAPQAFGTPASPAFGTPASPAFGTVTSQVFGTVTSPAFGTPASPAFGTPASPASGTVTSKLFGTVTSQAFGTVTSQVFGTVTSPASGTVTSKLFGTPAPPAFGTVTSKLFGTPAPPAFGTVTSKLFGTGASKLFGTGASPAFGTVTSKLFGTVTSPAFGTVTSQAFGTVTSKLFGTVTSPASGTVASPAFGTVTSQVFGTVTSQAFGTVTSPAFGTVTSQASGTVTSQASGTVTSPAFGTVTSQVFGTPALPAFGTVTSPAFGTVTSKLFGTPALPAFGTVTSQAFGTVTSPAFGTVTSQAFGTVTSPAFGTVTSQAFGTVTSPAFGTVTSPAFGTVTSQAFGTVTSPAFGTVTSQAFGTVTSPAFGTVTSQAFGTEASQVFGTVTSPAFGTVTSQAFGTVTSPAFGTVTSQAFGTVTSQAFGTEASQAFGTEASQAFGTAAPQAFGTAASQAFGTEASQAFGTPASQAFGTPASQAFGTPASQAFGTPASQAFGTPASQAFGTEGQKTHWDSEETEAPWRTGFSEQAHGLDLSEHVHRACERNRSPFSTNGSKGGETLVKKPSQEDFTMVKGISQEDFSTVKGTSQEDFSTVKGTSQEDFSTVKGTSQEDFSTVKGTSQEDFSMVKGISQEDFSTVKGTSQEDFSMVIDSDIFVYIQKHCSEDYRSILDRHSVEVLDVSTNDITTLYLQLKTGAVRRGRGDLSRAHVELSWLYQEKEAQLRREQLPKAALLPQRFQDAVEVLQDTFPKLLINEDTAYIYFVGSGNDVSEAKKFMMINGTTKDHNQAERESSNILFQPSGSSSVTVPDVCGGAQFRQENLKGGRCEGGVSAEKPTSISEHRPFQDEHSGNCQPLSEKHTRECSNPKDRRFLGEDILFKEAEPEHNRKPLALFSPSDSKTQVKSAANSGELFSLDTADLSRPGGEEFTTASGNRSESGHTLRRTNSFSSPVRPKQGHNERISEEDLPLKHNHYADFQEVHNMGVKVPLFQWIYMKQFQHNEIADITSDVKMTEAQTRKDITLLLTGADAATVRVSQERLKELIKETAKEFTTNELPLASLDALDSRSETVERLCRATRERFVGVQIIPLLKSIFFLGPKLECLEAMSSLRERFPGGGRKFPEQGHLEPFSTTSTDYSPHFSSSSLPSEVRGAEERDRPQCLQYKRDGETDSVYSREGVSLKSDASPSEHVQGDATQDTSGRIDGVEDQRTPEPSERTGLRDTPVRQEGSPPPPPLEEDQNGSGSSDDARDQSFSVKPSETGLPLSMLFSETRPPADTADISRGEGATHNQGAFLEDHGDVESPSTTSGGADARQQCQGQDDPYCSDCPESEMAGPQSASNAHYEGFEDQQEDQTEKSKSHESEETLPGIRGTMTCSEMSLSLPGHSKHTTLKISYTIPDGVQGVTHPNPGAPFQGGLFHTYLPMNETSRRLLPALERAFHQGLTFSLRPHATQGARLVLGSVPLKTSVDGGQSRNGYPDSGYIRRLTESLKGI